MAVKNIKFKTEAQKVLRLVTHSLYSNKDIFLRELISNASDAIDKLRFESLTNNALLGGDTSFGIKLLVDKDKKTFIISDNGIGMNEEELISNIGTIARSGTQGYLELLERKNKEGEGSADDLSFIGQFGVGFYSSFMVSSKVEVLTRKAGDDKAFLWRSEGDEDFSIEEASKEGHGTEIKLYLNDDSVSYLDEWKIKEIVKKYSDYIEFPILMDVEKTEYPEVKEGEAGDEGKEAKPPEPIKKIEEETLNSQKAIWLRSKDEVKDEEYEDFYKHISHDFSKPLKQLHYRVEGVTEFTALIYIPSMRPFDLFTKEYPKSNIHLYVNRVFILSNSEYVLPEYLRFIQGVVDSSDLPLNISREHLQEHRVLKVIKKNLVNKILSTLEEIRDSDKKAYSEFSTQFGALLKEGVYSDTENKERLLSLLLYYSTKSGDELIGLDDYILKMPEDQKAIYFIAGEERKEVENLVHLEAFKDKGYEVLFFLEPIDEIMLQYGLEYKGKQFQSVSKGDIDFGEKDGEKEGESKDLKEKFVSFNEFMKKSLEEHVKDVRLSDRLVGSASCLVNDANDMSANLEKIMKAYNKELPSVKRILELNPKHPVIEKMSSLFAENADNPVLKDYAYLIYDQALISEGSKVSDPKRLCNKISELLLKV